RVRDVTPGWPILSWACTRASFVSWSCVISPEWPSTCLWNRNASRSPTCPGKPGSPNPWSRRQRMTMFKGLALVMFTLAATPAPANPPRAEPGVVALVTTINGDVRIEREGEAKGVAAEAGAGLRPGDALVTAPQASASLVLYSGPVRTLSLDGGRRWLAPAGQGLAWAPGLRTERGAAVVRRPDLPPSILLPRWTRSEGLPFGQNWSREFPDLEEATLSVFRLDEPGGEPTLQLSGKKGVVIPGGSLAAGQAYRWQLSDAGMNVVASGQFEIISSEALESIRRRLAELPENPEGQIGRAHV